MIFFKIYKYIQDKEFQSIFYTNWRNSIDDLKFEKEEVEAVKWVDIVELQKIFRERNKLWVHDGYENDLLTLINKS
jgi:hypothetical protein